MPELPEVEVLVGHLTPRIKGKTIREVDVRRARIIRPTSKSRFRRGLLGATFQSLTRRGKYLIFALTTPGNASAIWLLGHLGMTGRMYVQPTATRLPKHAAVVFSFRRDRLVFEDVRGFGRLTLDMTPLSALGPEPFGDSFVVESFGKALKRSVQPIKVKLLDQSLIAGVGNIYASEALFHAGISPRLSSCRLTLRQVARLCRSLKTVLTEAIKYGTTVPLDWAGEGSKDGLFYYGRSEGLANPGEQHLRVYDRAGRRCIRCGALIRRIIQTSRSTYYCPRCQRQ